MNRFWGHTLSSALVAVAAACAFPACSHNDGSLFVHGVLAPPTPSGGTCTYTADPTAATLPRGRVDAALINNYAAEFLLGSALIAQANPVTPQNETARLTIQGADVRIVDPRTNTQIGTHDELVAGVIDAAAGAAPSYLAIGAPIMDAAAVAHFDPAPNSTVAVQDYNLAEVYVKFYGTTLGGQYIESDEYLFPVEVCHGCLVNFPVTPNVRAYCSGTGSSLALSQVCQVGWDQIVDCQQCFADSVVCAGP